MTHIPVVRRRSEVWGAKTAAEDVPYLSCDQVDPGFHPLDLLQGV